MAPTDPENGHRFNPNKLLLDPYARTHFGDLVWDPAVFGYVMESGDDTTFDEAGQRTLHAKMRRGRYAQAGAASARTHGISGQTRSFHETHVRGYTKRHPAVPENLRGTYEGLATPEVIRHIKDLGVTAVELLPIQTFVTDKFLIDKGLTNFWGYNSIGFFAPDPRYAADPLNSVREFKDMWRASTTRVLKSFSTSSSITRLKATRRARRCRSRASTIVLITSCSPITRASITTIPAPGTRSISPIHA